MRRATAWRMSAAWSAIFGLLLGAEAAEAYIGPGAGFAAAVSFLAVFVAVIVAIAAILGGAARAILRLVLRGQRGAPPARQVLVLGLDGLSPDVAEKLMAEGKLPNFQRLATEGTFRRLQTTCPAMSPVAWSSFQTGCNPGKHDIYDFLALNRRTYEPELSSAEVGPPRRVLRIGPYGVPLSGPRVRLRRRSQAFWRTLGEHGVFCIVQRVPITFPPERFFGVCLSGMCVPDLLGTQGTFRLFVGDGGDGRRQMDGADGSEEGTGGVAVSVSVEANRFESVVPGPPDPVRRDGRRLELPVRGEIDRAARMVRLEVGDQHVAVHEGEYTDWVRLTFRGSLGTRVAAISRFRLMALQPEFRLYMTPMMIDPERPALGVAHPTWYSAYLAKRLGPFATLGLAEDSWGLNEGALDEEGFLSQCWLYQEERERMLWDALEKAERGLCVAVLDVTDRVQHMFWEEPDGGVPPVIEELYSRMDELVGRVRDRLRDDGVLVIVSDHGFRAFERGVDLNAWLHQNGYLMLQDGTEPGDWFRGVDWPRTRAFSFGLAGVYINVKGRYGQGAVSPEEVGPLRRELKEKLTGLVDEDRSEVAIEAAFESTEVFRGPYEERRPDLVIGYARGYRSSWECATGRVTDEVFSDNERPWKGDHCVNPAEVPGVLFCNRKIMADHASIMDVAPTVLKLYGIDPPAYMDGEAWEVVAG